tara:strand:- start:548 stop:838 length:291 start_codon:yes stop_codon:yes gene_type:complete
MVDKTSSEYMFGQIIQRLEASDRVMEDFKAEFKSIHLAISQLPCASHQKHLNSLEEWRKRINGKTQTAISLKNGIVIALIASGFTGLITFLVFLLK